MEKTVKDYKNCSEKLILQGSVYEMSHTSLSDGMLQAQARRLDRNASVKEPDKDKEPAKMTVSIISHRKSTPLPDCWRE